MTKEPQTSKDAAKKVFLSGVSTNVTVQVELIREGFWHIVTTKEWR